MTNNYRIGDEMLLFRKISIVILSFVCLIFSCQIIFAQNIDTVKSDIYSKLKCCACNISFDKCVCPEAKEMKTYIEALLEKDINKEDIFYKVAKKFSLNVILDEEIKTKVEKRLVNEASKRRPQIILEPTSFNFGKVSKKQGKISKIFKLYNKGNLDLIITNVRVSCSCVAASLKIGKNKSPYFGILGATPGWQALVEPGKSGQLEIILDLAHPSMAIGKEIRDIFLSSNDPVYPQVTIRVEVDVEEAHHQHLAQEEKKENLGLSGKLENGIRIIEVKASRYKFEPDPIVVKFGEKVHLIATSLDVTHGLAIAEFKVNLVIPTKESKAVEFIADKKGTFHAYCSVYCGPGHGHMHASFVVK